jgi:hypothetical protein
MSGLPAFHGRRRTRPSMQRKRQATDAAELQFDHLTLAMSRGGIRDQR